MHSDFSAAPDGQTFSADVCVVGTGAAGITLTTELIRRGLSVCLVESGGFELDGATQSLHEVENTGISRRPTVTTRLRMFGGTTNHWTGKCGRLDELDFEARPWVPDSGWPITRRDLDPFYDRAQPFLDLAPRLTGAELAAVFDAPAPDLDGTVASLYAWQLSPPTRFGPKFRDAIERSPQVQLLLNASVVNVQANADASRVEHLDIRSLDGKTGKVKAQQYVIGCGGIENARLLLLSDNVMRGGLGNQNDLVGRYFMEHLRNRQLVVFDSDPYTIQRVYNTYHAPEGLYLLGLGLSRELQEKEQILNAAFFANFEATEASATDSASHIASALAHGEKPADFSASVLRAVQDLDQIAVNVRRKLLRRGSRELTNELSLLVIETEQAPNRDSRIDLSSQRDLLGLRRPRVQWRMNEMDRKTVLTAAQSIAGELWRHHRARMHLPDSMQEPLEDWVYNFKDVSHHIGTTRMAEDPKRGVVDKHCQVHGTHNLYMAGSSVFPTGGHVNPTMTIVALAVRLSDHLVSLHGKG